MEGLTMLWLYIAAAGVGSLLGLLWLRLLALLAGSVVLVAVAIVMAALGHWPPLEAVINVFLLLATLQFSYLVALVHANSVPGSL
jgi:hypothetical protein